MFWKKAIKHHTQSHFYSLKPNCVIFLLCFPPVVLFNTTPSDKKFPHITTRCNALSRSLTYNLVVIWTMQYIDSSKRQPAMLLAKCAIKHFHCSRSRLTLSQHFTTLCNLLNKSWQNIFPRCSSQWHSPIYLWNLSFCFFKTCGLPMQGNQASKQAARSPWR